MRPDIYQEALENMFQPEQIEANRLNPEYDADRRYRVFVYGSIKQGFGNDWIMIDNPVITRTVTREARFDMISMIKFPAVIEGGNDRIFGELYEVNGQALEILDQIEGNGVFYQRQLVDLVDVDEPAWMYILCEAPDESHRLGVVKLAEQANPNEVIALYWQGLPPEVLEEMKERRRKIMEQEIRNED